MMGSTIMDNIVQGPYLDELPSEILEEIFRYMPTCELLRSCRLVSDKWYEIATMMCRSRYVSVKPKESWDYSSKSGFRETFMNATILPWTSVELQFIDNAEHDEFNSQLCKDFGTEIQSLSATLYLSARNDFFSALRRLPNLRQLNICNDYDNKTSPEPQPFTFPQQGELELLQLNDLRITNFDQLYYEYFEFLEFMLVNSGAQLKSADIDCTDVEGSSDELGAIFQLLYSVNTNIQYLSLHLYYGIEEHDDAWALLAQLQQFRVYRVDVQFYLHWPYEHHMFHLLERFLNNSVGLTILCLEDLEDSIMSSAVSSFFQSLNLPDLKTLILKGLNSNDTNDSNHPMLKSHPVQPPNFPKLENAKLQYYGTCHQSLDNGKRFYTVRHLEVLYCYGVGEGIFGMSSIFPKTTKIRARIQNAGQIASILDGMPHVTRLDLELSDDVLSQDAIESMLSLKNLRVLNLDFCYGSNVKLELPPTTAILLMQLPPLCLNIHGREVNGTNPAVVRLRKHHISVQSLSKSFLENRKWTQVKSDPPSPTAAFNNIGLWYLVKFGIILLGCVYLKYKFTI